MALLNWVLIKASSATKFAFITANVEGSCFIGKMIEKHSPLEDDGGRVIYKEMLHITDNGMVYIEKIPVLRELVKIIRTWDLEQKDSYFKKRVRNFCRKHSLRFTDYEGGICIYLN